MAYAARDDVLSRAGRFAGVFSVVGKRPNESDLDALLDDVSAIMDAEIRARGYDPDLLTPELVGALRDVAAWATLLRALPQAVPGEDAEELIARAREIVTAAGFPGLASGATEIFAALAALEAGAGGGGPGTSAGSFWDDLAPDESALSRLRHNGAVTLVNGELPLEEDASEPLWTRGQSL